MNNTKIGKATIHFIMRKVFRLAGEPLKAWQLQRGLYSETGKWYSESSVTARTREMRDVRCNLSGYTYELIECTG